MKTTYVLAGILLTSSSLALGCAAQGTASVSSGPPPVVEGQANVNMGAQGGAQGEIVVQGEPPPPPPPQPETEPPSPGVEYVWVGGYHRWNGRGYAWVGGRYEHRPHPDAHWRGAHWDARGSAHVWVDGSWDTAGGANANAKLEPQVGAPPPVAAPQAPGGAHPWYLHALSDLRNARAHLQREGGERQMKWDERDAVAAIDRAIHDIKEAAIDDGKNLDDHPAVDAREARAGRLHKAADALRTARGDIDKEEDNAFARGLRGRASHDIDEAIRFTADGVRAADQMR
jgi:hypothetical protein